MTKKNYLVFVGIGCLISVMLAMPPPQLSFKDPNRGFHNISQRVVLEAHQRTRSWLSSAIELETRSAKATRAGTGTGTGTTKAQLPAALNVSGHDVLPNNSSSESGDGLIRLFPRVFPEASSTKLPGRLASTTHSLRARPKNDGITIRYRAATVATPPTTEAVQSLNGNGEQQTTDSWPVNPWGGVNFLQPPVSRKKGKRSRTDPVTFRPSHTKSYYTTIYWWYPVLTDNPNWKYIPDRVGVTKVCRGKSTVYNVPVVYDWLTIRVRNKTMYARPVFMPLRKELFDFGLSEMCHTNDTREWSDYINCAIIRNMRMEYMIPKYPLHQIAYFYPTWHGSTAHPQGHVSTHGPGWGGGK
ncbi:uncharacterized protein DMAD_03592 [Drosophila madeirensis]|uniref:Uncharacterized protein n=1 Tax=Drosophila madeirensis TaxID=30013 RepID=A0AAU9GB60_DROMD